LTRKVAFRDCRPHPRSRAGKDRRLTVQSEQPGL